MNHMANHIPARPRRRASVTRRLELLAADLRALPPEAGLLGIDREHFARWVESISAQVLVEAGAQVPTC